MGFFRESENSIFISDGEVSVSVELGWFKNKYPEYEPVGQSTERVYQQGLKHSIVSVAYEESLQNLPWNFGDTIINQVVLIQKDWFEFAGIRQNVERSWKKFRTLFMGDLAYNRMANSVLGTPAQRIETWISAAAAIETEEWELFAGYWNNFVYYVPDEYKATTDEVVAWNQIAAASDMPFIFKGGGKMELTIN